MNISYAGQGFTKSHIEAILGIEELTEESDPMLTSAMITMIRYALGASVFMPPNDKYYMSRMICNHVCLILSRQQIAFEFLHETHLDVNLLKDKNLPCFGYYPHHNKAPVLPLKWA